MYVYMCGGLSKRPTLTVQSMRTISRTLETFANGKSYRHKSSSMVPSIERTTTKTRMKMVMTTTTTTSLFVFSSFFFYLSSCTLSHFSHQFSLLFLALHFFLFYLLYGGVSSRFNNQVWCQVEGERMMNNKFRNLLFFLQIVQTRSFFSQYFFPIYSQV